jgi:Delta3-Delta2-enoyl-CoA isomerase
MSTPGIERSDQKSIAVLSMNTGNQNKWNAAFVAGLRSELAGIKADRAIKAVVITGADKYFSNGLDLAWMPTQSKEGLYDFLFDAVQLLRDTALFPKPIVGAINGHAFGLGAIWPTGFDQRVMRVDRGWVCYPEMDINIPFTPGMIAHCVHGVGSVVFREMAWSAKKYTGAEALRLGWAQAAVPEAELLPNALAQADFLGNKGALAFSTSKAAWAYEVARTIDERDPAALRTFLATLP